MDRPRSSRRFAANTHVHLPPNFSAFDSPEDAVAEASREDVAVLGVSNYHNFGVYPRFADAAARAGITPLFGVEIICVLDSPGDRDVRVNDPVNPGRMYLCGKGLAEFANPGPEARRLISRVRDADAVRMREVIRAVRACFAAAGIETDLTDDAITGTVAERAAVPPAWVTLQERHVAMAFQEAVFRGVPAERRREILARALGSAPTADPEEPAAVQDEIRARLMKAGRPAFVPESPVSYEDARRLVLELGGIPCYPTLADGASPVCPWEETPSALVRRVQERGIHAAELIPERNESGTVDRYIAAFRSAGIIVTAGTEHNTRRRLPVLPRCSGGVSLSPSARDVVWEGACIVAAHQHLVRTGRPGYVDRDGRLNAGFPDGESRIRWFRELGEHLVAEGRPVVAS